VIDNSWGMTYILVIRNKLGGKNLKKKKPTKMIPGDDMP
jgi:hypothetical protein